MNQLSGKCACAAVTYTSSPAAAGQHHMDYCYCTTCQNISGAPFVPWLGVSKDTLTFVDPESVIITIRLVDFATRTFCNKCGGTLTMSYDFLPGKVYVAAGTIVEYGSVEPQVGAHIFVRSKPFWYRIADDGVRRWDTWDDEFRERFPDVVAKTE